MEGRAGCMPVEGVEMADESRVADRPWGRCARCAAETHLDPSSALCPRCEEDRLRGPQPTTPTYVQGHPHSYFPPQGQAVAYPYASPYPYAAPYPYVQPYAVPYPYAPPYATKPPELVEAESAANIGLVLTVIGLLIVFPFGFISIVLGTIGMLLGYSGYRKGAGQGMWAIVLGVLVIALGSVTTVLLFTPTWA